MARQRSLIRLLAATAVLLVIISPAATAAPPIGGDGGKSPTATARQVINSTIEDVKDLAGDGSQGLPGGADNETGSGGGGGGNGTGDPPEPDPAEAQQVADGVIVRVRDRVDDAQGPQEPAPDVKKGAGAFVMGALEIIRSALANLFGQGDGDGSGSGSGSMAVSDYIATTAAQNPAILVAQAAGIAISLAGIVYLVRRLLPFGLMPLLSRIKKSDLYENDARRLVADLVDQNPGLCLHEVVARTGYSRNAVSYHLFVLEKEELLTSVKDGKYRRYFTRGGKYVNGAKNVVSVLKNETSLRMAQYVRDNPGVIQRDVCDELGTTPSAACWHAKRLEGTGVLRKERQGNTVQYFLGPAVEKYDLADFGLAAPVAAGA